MAPSRVPRPAIAFATRESIQGAPLRTAPFLLALSALVARPGAAGEWWLWREGGPAVPLIEPAAEGPMAGIAGRTLNRTLGRFFGRKLETAPAAGAPGLYLLAGDETNNPVLGELARGGLDLDRTGLDDEGFRIVTCERGDRRFVIVAAATPAGIKHGCQELVFFRLAATTRGAFLEVPLDVRMRPAFPYRGIYMLPCWAAHDSVASWQRVLEFNSELTLNRVWFWLAGFPLLEAYGGEYGGTDLAVAGNVRRLVEFCRAEGMKFHAGGGWFTWHHEKAVRGDIERGIRYYLDLLELCPGIEGLYLEPAGEGRDVGKETWRPRVEALEALARRAAERRPGIEIAIAIGRFNAESYRKAVRDVARRLGEAAPVYWWWCWGDPIRDGAVSQYPRVLRWHTAARMSEYHGSTDPPRPEEAPLAGLATSYDPGMGFGNPWNGWAAMGVERPREFDPYTLPYFSHQYRFREGLWNPQLSEAEFEARMSRRLFDADMPRGAVRRYLELAALCREPLEAGEEALEGLEAWVREHAGSGTARNRDTLARMEEALEGIRRKRGESKRSPAETE